MNETPNLFEGDAGDEIQVTFWEPDGSGGLQAWTPTTVEYMVHDLSGGTAIKSYTAETPASSVTITLEAEDTEILDDDNEEEYRQVTVVADRGLVTQKTEVFRYFVRNVFTAT